MKIDITKIMKKAIGAENYELLCGMALAYIDDVESEDLTGQLKNSKVAIRLRNWLAVKKIKIPAWLGTSAVINLVIELCLAELRHRLQEEVEKAEAGTLADAENP